jgi:predicted metal-dependent phosphotriesterase family hydrolase
MTDLADDYDWEGKPQYSFTRVLNVIIPTLRNKGVEKEEVEAVFSEKLDQFYSEEN